MLDLTVRQLEKIREALRFKAIQDRADLDADILADQVGIIIDARRAEARRMSAPQQKGIVHIDLKGR